MKLNFDLNLNFGKYSSTSRKQLRNFFFWFFNMIWHPKNWEIRNISQYPFRRWWCSRDMIIKTRTSIFQNYHFFENAETKLFQNWPMFCPILWYSQMICYDTITLCYQTKVTMIAGVISILTYIVLRSRKGQKFFFLTNKAKFAHHFLLIDSPIYIYTFFL